MSTAMAVVTDTTERNRLTAQLILRNATRDELALVIGLCDRYGLDPLLKHIVVISHNIYVTRDGLLHIAHASKQLDGMEVSAEKDDRGMWVATCRVYRKDMRHPFVYQAHQQEHQSATSPVWKNAPRAMTIKCAEVMALRRAFDVSIGASEEVGYDEQSNHTNIGAVEYVEHRPDDPPPALPGPRSIRPAADLTAAGPPDPEEQDAGDEPLTDDQLLEIIRDGATGPDERWAALWDYYDGATTVAQLNERADVAYESGMETRDLKAAYKQHHERLSKLFAPASISG